MAPWRHFGFRASNFVLFISTLVFNSGPCVPRALETEDRMKILVTGGAGFIASHVVDRLIAEGHEVAIVDNLSTGSREDVNPKARFYELDLVSPALRDVFERERPEVVNHHAAQANVTRSMSEPMIDATNNVLGSLNLFECARTHGVRKVVYASTGGAVYGEPQIIPVPETHPAQPLAHYGVSKHAAELHLRVYAVNFGLTYTILRYANVYGPRQVPHGEAGVVPIFATTLLAGGRPRIFGDGKKTRDYIHVADVAEANVLALTLARNEIVNVGTGVETTDFEVFDAVRKVLGLGVEPIYAPKRPGEVERIALDIAKAGRLLHWHPRMAFRDGIALTIPYYQKRYGAPPKG
jgi:UDP-glucose 4-epimerase